MRPVIGQSVILLVFVLIISTLACGAPRQFSTDDIETGSLVIPPDQEFEIAEYSAFAIERSLARRTWAEGFMDRDDDGVPDGVRWGEREITGEVSRERACGYCYGNKRYAVFYPAEIDRFPDAGEIRLMGFIHYFDDGFLDVPLAVVLKQKPDDPGKTGTQAAFISASGMRVGNPAYAFYSREAVEALPSYQRWPDSGLDFALAADPEDDAFFIILKDLDVADEVMIVAYKWY